MRLSAIAAAIAAATLLAGCMSSAAPVTTFNSAEVAWASGSGSGSVSGQGFLRQAGGAVVTAAGSSVLLCPDSTYTQEVANYTQRMGVFAQSGVVTPEWALTCRESVAGVDGDFRFTGLPAGNYRVFTEVTWVVPGAIIPQGGVISAPVTVVSGQEARVIVSR